MTETTCEVAVPVHTQDEDDEYKPTFRYGEPDLEPNGGAALTAEGA